MYFQKLIVGQLEVNCYVLAGSDSSVVIDPGDDFHNIVNLLKTNKLTVDAIINTHGHFDHIGANSELTKEYDCPVYIHKDEMQVLKDSNESLAFWSGANAEIDYKVNTVEDKEILELGGLKFKVVHTPGHSPGGICLLQNGNLFTGDTLFKQSIGRTDFPDSEPEKMQKSLAILTQMDEPLKVYPGHGEPSDMEEELSSNPYLQDFNK